MAPAARVRLQVQEITQNWTSVLWLLAFVYAAKGQELTVSQIADFNALSQGLGTLATSSIYISRQHLFGTAMAVAVANNGGPMISANRYGLGRVIHFGHESMLSSCCSGTGVGGLVANAAQWAAGTDKASDIHVAHYGMSTVVNNLVMKVGCTYALVEKVPCGGRSDRREWQIVLSFIKACSLVILASVLFASLIITYMLSLLQRAVRQEEVANST
jgi:hypothetical protein